MSSASPSLPPFESVRDLYRHVIDEVIGNLSQEFEEAGLSNEDLDAFRQSWEHTLVSRNFNGVEQQPVVNRSIAHPPYNVQAMPFIQSSSSSSSSPSFLSPIQPNLLPSNQLLGQPQRTLPPYQTMASTDPNFVRVKTNDDKKPSLPSQVDGGADQPDELQIPPVDREQPRSLSALQKELSDPIALKDFIQSTFGDSFEVEIPPGFIPQIDGDVKIESETEPDDKNGVKTEPLGPDEEDIGDYSDGDDPKTDNLIVCQYEKITRVKSKRRCIFVMGLMHINHKDHFFQKATGECDFHNMT